MSELYYLASPYSKFPGGRQQAFHLACKKAADLMEKGLNIFCPIAHSHSIEVEGMSIVQDGDWWLEQDFAVLGKCDGLLVYKMPGWEDSYGVQAEIQFAKDNSIPIGYVDYAQ